LLLSVVEHIEVDSQIVDDVLFRGCAEFANNVLLYFALICRLLICFEDFACVLFQVSLHHLFAEQLHAAVVVADHEQTRFDVILGKAVLFTVFVLVLSAVECLAFAG
jgi:hypothetical protein